MLTLRTGSTTIEYEGKTYPLGDSIVAVVGHRMHWNPDIFPEPSQFWPERFFEAAESDSTNGAATGEKAAAPSHKHLTRHPKQASFPRNAFRPFERGLRSCLGMHLAIEEMRVLLLATVRFFDYELVDHAPREKPSVGFTDHDTRIGKHAFQMARVAAGPSGTASMKVRFAAPKALVTRCE